MSVKILQGTSLLRLVLIYDSAERQEPYLQCGMLLALITGQRPGDICNMQFKDIWDDMLLVEQEKKDHV